MSVKRSLTLTAHAWLQSVSSLLNMQWHVGMAMEKSPQITWSGMLAKARSSGNSPKYGIPSQVLLNNDNNENILHEAVS